MFGGKIKMAVHNVKSNPAPVQIQSPAATNAASEATRTEKSTKANSAAGAYAKAATAPNVKDAANVQISPRAKEMSMARKAAENAPDVDEAKIAKLKEKIAKGEYKPDAHKIADGIAKEALMDEYAQKHIS